MGAFGGLSVVLRAIQTVAVLGLQAHMLRCMLCTAAVTGLCALGAALHVITSSGRGDIERAAHCARHFTILSTVNSPAPALRKAPLLNSSSRGRMRAASMQLAAHCHCTNKSAPPCFTLHHALRYGLSCMQALDSQLQDPC